MSVGIRAGLVGFQRVKFRDYQTTGKAGIAGLWSIQRRMRASDK